MNKTELHNWYNATSTDDGKGEIETYEAWLERQLISRIEAGKNKTELKKKIGKSINNWFPLGHRYTAESDRKNMKKEIYKLIDCLQSLPEQKEIKRN